MYLLYNILIYLFSPFFFLRLFWRGRKLPDYRYRIAERLGFAPHSFKKCIWVHAVSVGETIAAIPLIKSLKNLYPDLPIIITNMTPTGSARVKAAFGDEIFQAYIPYDFYFAVTRFIKKINPLVLIVMETELWPNLFAIAAQKQIPIILTNARLSKKSARGYSLIKSLTLSMLKNLTALASQGYADAKRFQELGIESQKVNVTGNLKFDLELPKDLPIKTTKLRQELGAARLIWIAASTHPSEEEIILAAHKKILEVKEDALLILVPRHPDRFNAVAELIKQHAFNFVRRSQNNFCNKNTAVYLADTMGELLLMYAVSDVAFVAGSLVPIGGHNMLEAAALQKPIITGPYLFNFAEISQMLIDANGLIKIDLANNLAPAILKLLLDANERNRIGKNALSVVEANRGALDKQLKIIKDIIESRSTHLASML